LFNRVVAINAGALVVAALVLALSPATVSSTLTATEVVVLAFGTVSLIALNIVLLRQVFGPLERLASVMRRVSPEAPGRRLPVEGQVTEVADVCKAFNAMLDRLEDERRTSGARALTAQENERRRLARELHDEVGQTLTGVVLQLEGLERAAPPELRETVAQLQETAREGVERSGRSPGACDHRRSTSSGFAARSSRSAPRSPTARACASDTSWDATFRCSLPNRISRSTAWPRRA
jgi:two-component system sensor histidine kinase UhpB